MAEPSESRLYKEFVTRSLSEVQRGLKLDSYDPSSKKRKVCFALETQDRKRPNRTAAEKVIDGRFALGGDDASYLASGLATLWSTVGDVRDPNEDELGLAPASLYAPDAVNGVRKGLLAALERRNEELRKEAPRSLPKLLKALQVLLEQIDASSSETPELNDLMERGTVRTVEERTMLLAFLMRLRELLHPTQDDNLAQLILSKGREQITQLVDRFEKDQAELVAEHERRCKELLAGETLSRAVLTARNVELWRLLGACEDKLRRIKRSRGSSSGAATPPSASSGGGSGPSSEGSSPSGFYGVLNPDLVRDLLGIEAVRNAEQVAQLVTDALGPPDADPQAAKDAVAASLGPSDADPQAAEGAVTASFGTLDAAANANPTLRSRLLGWLSRSGAATPSPPPSLPPSPPPSAPASSSDGSDSGDDGDSVVAAMKGEDEYAAWDRQAAATRNALELRIKTLDQQVKDLGPGAEGGNELPASQGVASMMDPQSDALGALQALVNQRSERIEALRGQLEESQKAHEQLKELHAARLSKLEEGVETLGKAQDALSEVPERVEALRKKIDAKAAEATALKGEPATQAGDAQTKAAKGVELQKANQALAELRGKMAELETAQGAMKGEVLAEAKAELEEEVAKLRAEEKKRVDEADNSDKIDRQHKLERLVEEYKALEEAVKELKAGATNAQVVQALQERLEGIEGNFAEDNRSIASNKEEIERAKGQVGRLTSALDRLKELEAAKYTQMVEKVKAAQGKATDLQAEVMGLFQRVFDLEGDDAADDQAMAKLQKRLAELRNAAAQSERKLQQLASEQAELKQAKGKGKGSGSQDYDARFKAFEKALKKLSGQVDALASNQGMLKDKAAFDDKYETDDFLAHVLQYDEDMEDMSGVKQDLRKLYQGFRDDVSEAEGGFFAYRGLIESVIEQYRQKLTDVKIAWAHKDQSGKDKRMQAKRNLAEAFELMRTTQLDLVIKWMQAGGLNEDYARLRPEEYEEEMTVWINKDFTRQARRQAELYPDDDDASYSAFSVGASADAWTVPYAVVRGLVGQRGPTEPACASQCPTDALLPYAAPSLDAFVRHALPVKRLLAHSPDPTEEDVAEALKGCAPHAHSASDVGEALALLQDDFAITGVAPASELDPKRCGVELPHEVRWLPQGPRAGTMCRVAVLEHAAARCAQVANQADVAPEVARTLRDAAVSLKLQQLQPLYALNEAAAFDDAPHPLGTKAKLVTRPCAVVRGTLSFPVGAGIARAPEEAKEGTKTRDVDLSKAMNDLAVPTATMRNRLRRSGQASNVYVAPSPDALGFHPAPGASTGADAEGASAAATATPDRASEAVSPSDYGPAMWRRVINRAIVAAAAMQPATAPDVVASFLDTNKSDADGAGAVNARTRRQGLWNEMLRHVAISQDRLWVFVRLMSGCIGGDVQEVITMADAATLKASKAIEDQRTQIAKRVSDMQAKIVETVVASMLKKSEMTMSIDNDSVAVIDAEARKQLQELSSGASGRPFFEANVALKNLTERNDNPPRLQEVLNSLANVGLQMQSTLEQSLADPSAASASLVELSHPSNSYFVSMRADAVAAIREAHEVLNTEMGAIGGRRRLALWELVEGGCQVLTNRFAHLCGFLLVQARTSTGVSAMYVSHQSIHTNASQARVALAKLVAAASAYVARVTPPALDAPDLQAERWRVLAAGERVTDLSITATPRSVAREPLYAPLSSSGWTNVGGRRY